MANTHSQRKSHLLIMPFPAQGHMPPLLDLTRHLLALDSGFDITVLTTPKNLCYLSPLLAAFPCVQPLVLPFPAHPLIPDGVENCQDLLPTSLPTPSSCFPLFIHALGSLRSPLLAWARSIAAPPDAIVSDFFLGWTNGLAKELGIPRVTFSPSGAITLAINHHTWTNMPQNPNPNPSSTAAAAATVSYPTLPGSPCIPWHQLSSLYRGYVEGDPMWEFVREGLVANMESWGIAINSFRELEGAYLDHLKRELGHERVWAVGPVSLLRGPAPERRGPTSVSEAELMSWLDGCDSSSVVYVCFGTQVVLRQEQASAVAAALEESGVRFVWTAKEGGPATSAVPDGFEERTRGRGLVIRGWAPQARVLSHRSVGSFLTHCGWNSVLEAVAAGVTMLMWPMEADQFYNANLLEGARVGRRVCEGRDGVPRTDLLSRALGDSVRNSGEERRMAEELRKKALEAVEKDGSSRRDVGVLVDSLKNLCCINNGS